MKFRQFALFFASLTACLTLVASASANGRFPAANQLVVHPTDPNTFMVRATFGLLITHDRGQSFHLVCDSIIGSASTVDPGVGYFGNGAIVVAAPLGLAVSQDNACSFGFQSGDLANLRFIDVSADKTNPAHALALSATAGANGTESVRIFETQDNGVTWASISTGLDPNAVVTTLDLAPSNPQRVYMSGARVNGSLLEGFVATSNDGGRTFTYAVADFPNAQQIYIAAVDPLDADLLYLRTYQSEIGPSHLIVSRNGGKTFEIATTIKSNMSGFALSPDGSRVAIAGLQTGVQVATRPDAETGPLTMKFESRSNLPMRCLGWEGDHLYGCGSGLPVGCGTGDGQFLVGQSEDEGRTWTPVIRLLADIQEPNPGCAPESPSATICSKSWPALHAQLTCPFPDAGPVDSGKPRDAGPPAPPPPFDDCSCAVPGSGAGTQALGIGFVLLGAGAFGVRRVQARRRRARRSSR
jgi:hypothetical protein